jgi:hypothetical protein
MVWTSPSTVVVHPRDRAEAYDLPGPGRNRAGPGAGDAAEVAVFDSVAVAFEGDD